MESPAHARSFGQRPLSEGVLDILDPQVADSGPKRDLRRREHLRLGAGHVTDDRNERPRRCPLGEMVPGQPKGGDLVPGRVGRGVGHGSDTSASASG